MLKKILKTCKNWLCYTMHAIMLNDNKCCLEYMRQRWTIGMLPAIVLAV
jgi:hypothetical protein